MSHISTGTAIALAVLACCTIQGLCGCATNGAPKSAQGGDGAPASTRSPNQPTRIAVEAGAHEYLGQMFRYIGETYGGGGVLVAGLEEWPAPPGGLPQTNFEGGMRKLAAHYGFKTQSTPWYQFIYPAGYETLQDVAIHNAVDPRFHAIEASFAIGAGTDLFNALALLGNSLKVTVVADQHVADAWCGEVFLENAPLPAILEALLKSARVPPGAFEVESTSEYVFIRSTANKSVSPTCLNFAELTDNDNEMLATRVTLRLPEASPGISFQAVPATLEDVLPSIASQLGVPVIADPTMSDLPVNTAAFHGVSVRVALDLIVRQWLVPRYGYRVEGGGIRFCER